MLANRDTAPVDEPLRAVLRMLQKLSRERSPGRPRSADSAATWCPTL